jgi:hypothetical protein
MPFTQGIARGPQTLKQKTLSKVEIKLKQTQSQVGGLYSLVSTKAMEIWVQLLAQQGVTQETLGVARPLLLSTHYSQLIEKLQMTDCENSDYMLQKTLSTS